MMIRASPRRRSKQRGRGGPEAVAGQAARGAGVASGVDRHPERAAGPVPRRPLRLRRTTWPARADLGVVDRYQQHEIPQVAVTVTQYDQHQVECGCGRRHTAARPDGARPGPVGYGPNLAAFAVYLMVVHFMPAHRVVALLESLTGTAPSVGFVHGMLDRTAGLLDGVHRADPDADHPGLCGVLRRDPAAGRAAHPAPGKKKAERYLLVACTELYTHYLLGDRSLDHVQGLRGSRAGRLGDRARPLPELRVRHEALLLLFSDGGERPSIRSSS